MVLLMDMGRMNMYFLQYDVCFNKRADDKTFYDKITRLYEKPLLVDLLYK